MKIIAFNGSARKQGNTQMMLDIVFEALNKAGVDTEVIQLRGTHLQGCSACMQCFENRDKRCVLKGDDLNEWIARVDQADGLILASPTYFGNVSAEMKALIDRLGLVSFANPGLLRYKAGAAVAVCRRIGSKSALNAMNAIFFTSQMFIACSNYANMAIGMMPGDVMQDAMGQETMRILGQNMAKLLRATAHLKHEVIDEQAQGEV